MMPMSEAVLRETELQKEENPLDIFINKNRKLNLGNTVSEPKFTFKNFKNQSDD